MVRHGSLSWPRCVPPGVEVGVVVLPAGLEEMRMVRGQHGGDARRAQGPGDVVLPDLDRAPGAPGEVEGSDEDVVARRHARQRTGVVLREAKCLLGEAGDVGGGELAAAVGLEHLPVQAVQQDDHQVLRLLVTHRGPPLGDPQCGCCTPSSLKKRSRRASNSSPPTRRGRGRFTSRFKEIRPSFRTKTREGALPS